MLELTEYERELYQTWAANFETAIYGLTDTLDDYERVDTDELEPCEECKIATHVRFVLATYTLCRRCLARRRHISARLDGEREHFETADQSTPPRPAPPLTFYALYGHH
jgi:hypothetical protein